jgi:dipeptidyl aminopeptidase/acylaminoacyl peptidase
VSDRDGKRQVYVLSLDGGEAEAVTTSDTGVNAFDWAPDGTRIAFTQADAKPAAMKARDERDGEYEIVEEDRAFTHLHVVDLVTRKVERLTSGDFVVGSFEWSPDATRLAFDHAPTSRPGTGTDDISTCRLPIAASPRSSRNPGLTRTRWERRRPQHRVRDHDEPPGVLLRQRPDRDHPSAGGAIRSRGASTNANPWRGHRRHFFRAGRTWSYLHRRSATTKVERSAAAPVSSGIAFSRDFACAFTRATRRRLPTSRPHRDDAGVLTSNAQLDAWTGTRS